MALCLTQTSHTTALICRETQVWVTVPVALLYSGNSRNHETVRLCWLRALQSVEIPSSKVSSVHFSLTMRVVGVGCRELCLQSCYEPFSVTQGLLHVTVHQSLWSNMSQCTCDSYIIVIHTRTLDEAVRALTMAKCGLNSSSIS